MLRLDGVVEVKTGAVGSIVPTLRRWRKISPVKLCLPELPSGARRNFPLAKPARRCLFCPLQSMGYLS
jgi:hypothetical protein